MSKSEITKTNRLDNLLIVPVIEQDGNVTYKTLKNTMIGILSKRRGIKMPCIIKDLKTDRDTESWAERQWQLKGQLLNLTAENAPEIFGMKVEGVYSPVLVTGSTKSRVVFMEESLADKAKSLFTTPEELLSYGKAASTDYSCYGLWALNDVEVRVIPDQGKDLYRDGIGEISVDLLEEMNDLAPLVQFRAVRAGFSKPSIAKGCLKLNPELPQRTLILTEGQIKGAGLKKDWNGKQDLWVGILRSYKNPGKVKESWTSIEIPANTEVKKAEIAPAIKEAHRLMDIIEEPAKACEYKGLLDREDGFSMLDQVLRVAIGSKTSRKLPPLTNHPYIRLGLQDLMAAKLRGLAVDGVTKWDYLLHTGTMVGGHERGIETNLHKLFDLVVIRRYPCLIADSWGIIVERVEHDAEIQMSKICTEETLSDSDGDCIGLIKCPTRLEATKKARNELSLNLSKSRKRKVSTFWEVPAVIASQVGTSGIGSATNSLLGAAFHNRMDIAVEMAHEVEAAVCSQKWDCRPNIVRCREVLAEYPLPSYIAAKNQKSQFRRIDTTENFDSDLWNAVANVYRTRTTSQENNILPLSAYGSIFGHKAHGLSKSEYRSLVDVYRYYCSRIKHLSGLEDENNKQEKMAELFDLLRVWSSDKDQRWIAGAWMLCHSQSSKKNRAVFVFEVFRERLIEMLIQVFEAENVEQFIPDQHDISDKEQQALLFGLHGKLIRNGVSLEVEVPEIEMEEGRTIQTVAIVNLQNKSPEQIAEIIKIGHYELRQDPDRKLPALKSLGLSLYFKDIKVADILDSDVLFFNRLNVKKFKKDSEILVYRKSLKIVVVI